MKITIDDPIIALHPRDPDNWIVMQEYRYRSHGIDITIPRGFVTDLASIPRGLWWLIAPFELSTTAPIVHDWCYRHGLKTRAEIDELFLAIMKDEGVSYWRRYAAYWGVRMGGSSSFGSGKVVVEEIETCQVG